MIRVRGNDMRTSEDDDVRVIGSGVRKVLGVKRLVYC